MSEDEVTVIVRSIIGSMSDVSVKQMGQIIGQVRSKTGDLADGGMIAKIVKQELDK